MEKNKYADKYAIVILGGTSLKSYIDKLDSIDKKKFKIFVETKCISKQLFNNNIFPDYIICPFSAKLKDNYLQNFIFRSLVCGINIKKFLKTEYFGEVEYLESNFDYFYETWRPHRGIHKKFKFRKNLFLRNSPFENMKLFPNSNLIINEDDFKNNFENLYFKNKLVKINFKQRSSKFSLDSYYNVENIKGVLNFQETNFLNSQAICHFPLMKYLGFKKIFFLGMDMNFYGSFGFDFREIFKSKLHLYFFIFLIRKTLNGSFKMNFPIHLRPKQEFSNLDQILPNQNNFYRVITKDKSAEIPKINNIELDKFLEIIN